MFRHEFINFVGSCRHAHKMSGAASKFGNDEFQKGATAYVIYRGRWLTAEFDSKDFSNSNRRPPST